MSCLGDNTTIPKFNSKDFIKRRNIAKSVSNNSCNKSNNITSVTKNNYTDTVEGRNSTTPGKIHTGSRGQPAERSQDERKNSTKIPSIAEGKKKGKRGNQTYTSESATVSTFNQNNKDNKGSHNHNSKNLINNNSCNNSKNLHQQSIKQIAKAQPKKAEEVENTKYFKDKVLSGPNSSRVQEQIIDSDKKRKKKRRKSKPITNTVEGIVTKSGKALKRKRLQSNMDHSTDDTSTMSTSTIPSENDSNEVELPHPESTYIDRHNGKKRRIESPIDMILGFPFGKEMEITIEPEDTFKTIYDALYCLVNEDKEAETFKMYMNKDAYIFMARGPQAYEKSYDFLDESHYIVEEYYTWPPGTRLAVEEKIVEEKMEECEEVEMETEQLEIEEFPVCIQFELNGATTGAKGLESRILNASFDKQETLFTVAEYIYEKTGVDSFYLRIEGNDFKKIKNYSKITLKDIISEDMMALNIVAVIDPTIDIQTIHFSEKDLEKYEYNEDASVLYRAKYIPLRPTLNERHSLEMLISMLSVADYTTDVDSVVNASDLKKPSLINKRIMKQIRYINGFLTGNAISVNFEKGSDLATNKESCSRYATHFKKVFELGRRHKIRNPEKMKVEYGKMMYMLQDARSSQLLEQLGFDIITNVKSVYDELEKGGALAALQDPMIEVATRDIIDEGQGRHALEKIKRDKYKNIDRIARSFRSRALDEEQIKTCLYSIVDANCYLNQCARPVDIMLKYLQTYFSPHKEAYGKFPEFSCLSINEGHSGARLTHSHSRQYQFVLQSLTLWRTIIGDMYRLWYLAEEDILDMQNSPYELRNTGQGYQRVQNSPRVYKAMLGILDHVKRKVGRENWIGASRIHVGDNNVPNALLFIDKYNAVPKITSAIVCVLENIRKICDENRGIRSYVNGAFGGRERATVMILQDFFKHAFDGSGAETFDSAGSCIDGRLTAAWNWTQQIATKEYFPLFQLTGFTSFENAGN